uniref:Uncharacterized protein n=1 Tax=Panagrolaimus superbus TaxID=310955 RepID=A0A914Z777_9BILA
MKNVPSSGAGQTFDSEKQKCVNTKRLRYMSGILINKTACDETLRSARDPKPEVNQWPFGTACFYNNSDQFCHGDSGAGIMCRTLEEPDHVLVGLARAGPACCNKANENYKLNDPLPRNMVILDRGKRNWIQSLIGHFGLYKKLPSEAKKSNEPPPDYLD